jgi:hypothetical protein
MKKEDKNLISLVPKQEQKEIEPEKQEPKKPETTHDLIKEIGNIVFYIISNISENILLEHGLEADILESIEIKREIMALLMGMDNKTYLIRMLDFLENIEERALIKEESVLLCFANEDTIVVATRLFVLLQYYLNIYEDNHTQDE